MALWRYGVMVGSHNATMPQCHNAKCQNMAQIEIIMPKMGESIMEATIIKWCKQVGETIEVDETLLEIATDKVDSEIPSPVSGTLAKILFEENDTVAIGTTIALVATEGEELMPEPSPAVQAKPEPAEEPKAATIPSTPAKKVQVEKAARPSVSSRFYSPLVRTIAQKENISIAELETIQGTGKEGRVTKKDMLQYLGTKKSGNGAQVQKTTPTVSPTKQPTSASTTTVPSPTAKSTNGAVEIIEMDRMRRLIAEHMVRSKQTSPHVTSFVEIDVTNMVNWRNSVKKDFKEKHKENITFTPIFIEAVTKAIQDFPLVNSSVEGTKIIVKKDINIGMAAALPSGNLIVPVIKNADHLSLVGITKKVNDLAKRARENALKPEEIQGGTFTFTNVGTFGNTMGTPIINQPQVAILAAGSIKKKPAVLETEHGDVIAIRHMMFLSLSYDHRVVDGQLGGSVLRRIGDYLEGFDDTQNI